MLNILSLTVMRLFKPYGFLFVLNKIKTLLEMKYSLKINWLIFVLGLNIKFSDPLPRRQEFQVSSFLSFQKEAPIYECKLVTNVP
jgi:hypothetical protein